ncbi:unnamed protein product [Allacma fusca]|uniref:Lethal giant larvae homologue 2 domain-containing protein n=1 Tax=Allacma fusca TaxID=39272 RepID=A0A8J2PX40_9HEXA|nr:unnamed protein product [Allacma fusca]
MLKFIRGKGSGSTSVERAKLQRELYAFRKMTTHGFPSKPSALAYDAILRLLAIGNKSGLIRVLGRPGVEFSGQHPDDDSPILKIIFVPKRGFVITLTDDNTLHLWQIKNGAGASLSLIKSYPLDGKLKKISCLRLKQQEDEVFVGTEGGNVYTLDVSKFEITEQVIYLDVVLQNAPDTYKLNPGAVESVLELQDELIIGYERGLVTKWSQKLNKSVKHYIQNQQLEYLSIKSPTEIVSSHNDGSYVIWDLEKDTNQTKTVYGPYPCKKISKIEIVGDFIVFNGGLPRAAYGDHFSVASDIKLSGGEDGTKFSKNPWPIRGGEFVEFSNGHKDLFITGHEDGSVRFWDTSGGSMSLVGKFSFSSLFKGDEDEPAESSQEDEEWPPFRKVGTFDPYSDDPRLAVKKLAFCPKSGYLAIGGTAGQVVILNTKSGAQDLSKVDTVNLVAENFVWKGHDPLKYNKLVGVHALLQIMPPAAVTAIALEGPSGLVAVGTGHGFVLYDYTSRRVLMSKSTLNPSDVMASGDVGMSRRKSFKKSLRESFRRLRKGRSQRQPDNSKSPGTAVNADVKKPVERAIEARSSDDAMSSMVRSLSFAKTYLLSLQSTSSTLWAGTNAGTVYVFSIHLSDTRSEVACAIGKEIQLKHRAPVLSIIVLDSNSLSVDSFSPEGHPGPHRVLIGSEEQIKIFTLPNLRPFGKLKLTAQEGSRLRRMNVGVFTSVSDSYNEKCLCCLTNQGDLYVITLPDLKRQISTKCLRKEDISGISSLVFTPYGQGLFMCSSSELQRITLSAKYQLPNCSVPGIEPEGASNTGKNDFSLKDEALDVSGDITIDVVTDHTEAALPSNHIIGVENNVNDDEENKTEVQIEENIAETTANTTANSVDEVAPRESSI